MSSRSLKYIEPVLITEKAYLEAEPNNLEKHEFFDGFVKAMAGATEEHEIVAMNLAALIHGHLRGKRCRVFKSDMKLRVDTDDKIVYYYPDIMVVCNPRDKNAQFKEKPTLIIEVASKEWKRDYYEKLAAFLPIPSLKEYVVVWPNAKKPSVTIFRPESGLKAAETLKKGSFTLRSIDLTIDMADVYRQ